MFPTILSAFLTAFPGGDGPARNDARLLIATIESLQQPVEDFRCEFEGNIRFKGKVAENEKGKIGEDGLFETFSGVFIWKRGGDTHSDTLLRRGVDGTLARESLVVRMREKQAEWYHRPNDAPLGYSVIEDPKKTNSWRPNCLGWIFLIDKLKRDVTDDGLEASVSDDRIDGRPLKVLNIAIRGLPDLVILRYWIDLRRNGHVVRRETYQDKVMGSRHDIKLAPFKVGGAEVWMPVAGEGVSYGALVDRKPVITKEPTVLDSIRVVDGTMEFNKHPGPETFTIKYKLGTPISDSLRKLNYEFGQQKIGSRPTKAAAEKMLNEQVAKAEEQKAELVVASPSQGFDWSSWSIYLLGAIVLILLIALGIQRRRH
jgi:hypothetical protein